jgi:propanol-preferring alcohol dehydrogenase
MRAVSFADGALAEGEAPEPVCASGGVRIAVDACAVCRTDLHVLDGDLPNPKRPVILGHQVVGRVVESRADGLAVGARVGVPWLGWTCGVCRYCASGRENLCASAKFHGYTLDGGFAERMAADARYCFPLGPQGDAVAQAPLLCAGLIGHRAYAMTGSSARVGVYGFGSAAHILTQLASHEGRAIYAFVRPGDERGKAFARSLGAVWAGGSDEPPPEPLDAAIVFAPDGALVPKALRAVGPGGTVVCAGIHMSDIPSFPYADLWMERSIRSVANLTRADGTSFFRALATAPVHTSVIEYGLGQVAEALDDLRSGRREGSLVVRVGTG